MKKQMTLAAGALTALLLAQAPPVGAFDFGQ